jgi:hypothetical protein
MVVTYLLIFAAGLVVGLGVGRALWTHRTLRHLGAADHRARWAAVRESRRRTRTYDF